jgi:hypothetical protein
MEKIKMEVQQIAKDDFNMNLQANSIKYTQAHLDKVLQDYPDLTSNGFGSFDIKNFESDREDLRNDLAGFQAACVYLSHSKKISKINKVTTSYAYKHRVEAMGYPYLYNGTFIAAAIHMGYRLCRYPESLNASFNISDTLYKQFRK